MGSEDKQPHINKSSLFHSLALLVGRCNLSSLAGWTLARSLACLNLIASPADGLSHHSLPKEVDVGFVAIAAAAAAVTVGQLLMNLMKWLAARSLAWPFT